MFAQERFERVADLLKENGSVKVSQLMEEFEVSIETIRRDLLYLETQGVLRRVHGGAVAVKKSLAFKDLAQRRQENVRQKRQLAETAASFIQENDLIALDVGSTAMEFVAVLKERFENLTIVTCGLDVAEAVKDTSYELIIPGGQYCRKADGLFGTMTLEMLERLHVTKSFIFPSAVSLTYGIEDFIAQMAPVQQALMKIGEQVFIMADSSKFEARAFLRLSKMDPSFVYITDDGLDERQYKEYAEHSINIFRGALSE